MDLNVAIEVVENLVEEIAPHLKKQGWKVTSNARPVCRFGQCNYRKKEIILSENFVYLNPYPRIVLTGKHEIAHALVGPGHKHGQVWQLKAIELGIPPTTCSGEANMSPPKYIGICPNCNKVFNFYKKLKYMDGRYCRACGPKLGKFTVVPYTGQDFMED